MGGYSSVYIFLDDTRDPDWSIIPPGANVFIFRNYKSVVAFIESSCDRSTKITLDLDHDLGSKKTGYDFCKWLVKNNWRGAFRIHSQNPVGAKNMRQMLLHYGWVEI